MSWKHILVCLALCRCRCLSSSPWLSCPPGSDARPEALLCIWSTALSSCWALGAAQCTSLPLGKWCPGGACTWMGWNLREEPLWVTGAVFTHPPTGTHPRRETRRGLWTKKTQKTQAYKTIERIPSVSPQVSLQCCLSVSVFVKERIRIHSSVLLSFPSQMFLSAPLDSRALLQA